MGMKYLDENGLLYYDGKVKARLNNKVDKVSGKGLSANDYTTTEKNKLAGIEAGAEVNIIESIKINGTSATITGKEASITLETGAIDQIKKNGVALPIVDKAVDIEVPTKTSDLTNDSDFVEDANYVHTDNNYTTTEKNKLTGIAAGAEVNKIETIKVNGAAQTITSKAVDIAVPTKTSDVTNDSGFITKEVNNLTNYTKSSDLAEVATSGSYNDLDDKPDIPVVPTNVSAFTNDADYQTGTEVESAIAAAISSTYKAAGSVAFEDLPSLVKANLGKVYNVTNAFTTTADFVEGAGKSYPAGTNVAIIEVSTGVYKYDVLSSFVDLSNYYTKSEQTPITNAEIDTIVGD